MTESPNHPSPEVLRRLSTLRDIPHERLEQLCQELAILEEHRGEELLALGATEKSTLYLLEGRCRLVAEDGGKKIVKHTDPSALAPLASLRPSRYRVVAETAIRYLRIDNGLLEQSPSKFEPTSSLALETYQVEEEDDLGHMAAENRLTLQIYEDLNEDRLLLPSLPLVALRIGEAVNDEHADAGKVAKVIETDPAIALKMIKGANSARYGGVSQIATVAEAVARIGLQDTQVLVITFALRELFRTDSKELEQRMLALWEHSRRIAVLTQVLGDKVGNFNAQESLLAGLVHDIGVVAVIGYAREFPEVAGNPMALESSIQALRAQLGGMILSKWQLPKVLVSAAKEAENWYRTNPEPPDLADLVIVAQLHEGIGGDIDPAEVSALGRLGLSQDQIDGGLDVLMDAQEEIEAAHRQLYP